MKTVAKTIPAPIDLKTSRFKPTKIIYNVAQFVIAEGISEGNPNRIACRWHAPEAVGYPNGFGKPQWFILPEVTVDELDIYGSRVNLALNFKTLVSDAAIRFSKNIPKSFYLGDVIQPMPYPTQRQRDGRYGTGYTNMMGYRPDLYIENLTAMSQLFMNRSQGSQYGCSFPAINKGNFILSRNRWSIVTEVVSGSLGITKVVVQHESLDLNDNLECGPVSYSMGDIEECLPVPSLLQRWHRTDAILWKDPLGRLLYSCKTNTDNIYRITLVNQTPTTFKLSLATDIFYLGQLNNLTCIQKFSSVHSLYCHLKELSTNGYPVETHDTVIASFAADLSHADIGNSVETLDGNPFYFTTIKE